MNVMIRAPAGNEDMMHEALRRKKIGFMPPSRWLGTLFPSCCIQLTELHPNPLQYTSYHQFLQLLFQNIGFCLFRVWNTLWKVENDCLAVRPSPKLVTINPTRYCGLSRGLRCKIKHIFTAFLILTFWFQASDTSSSSICTITFQLAALHLNFF